MPRSPTGVARQVRVAPLLVVAAIAFLASGARGAGQAALPEIVFSSNRDDGDLVVMRPDGSHRLVLTPSVRNDRAPSWSPDGAHIAYTNLDAGRRGLIEVLDLRTSRLRRLGPGRSPDWSPDGTQLVYVDSINPADLATMNADGTKRRLLGLAPYGVTVSTEPAWSSHGSRIAFVGTKGLYTVAADGTGARQLSNQGRAGGAAWSPDDRKIVFDCGTDQFSLCVVRPDGSGFRGLTRIGHTPSWSPRGDLIAMTSYNRAATVLIRPNGRVVRTLPGRLDDEPDWSPDGKQLVVSHAVGAGSRLYATDSTGSRLARLTHGYLTDDFAPAWSPDGRWIAFRRQLQAHCSLDVLDVRTGRLRQLDRRGLGEHCTDRPDWSPDGKRILYAMTGSLWIVPRRSGKPRRVRGAGGAASSPRWTPDGRSIAFVSPRGIWVLGRKGTEGCLSAAAAPSRGRTTAESSPTSRANRRPGLGRSSSATKRSPHAGSWRTPKAGLRGHRMTTGSLSSRPIPS